MLEELADPSATISKGNGNTEQDTAAANVQRTGRSGCGISSAVMDEEAELSHRVSTGPPERPTQTKHTLGMAIVRGYVDCPEEAKTVPIGRKRKHGRPSRISGPLLRDAGQ